MRSATYAQATGEQVPGLRLRATATPPPGPRVRQIRRFELQAGGVDAGERTDFPVKRALHLGLGRHVQLALEMEKQPELAPSRGYVRPPSNRAACAKDPDPGCAFAAQVVCRASRDATCA